MFVWKNSKIPENDEGKKVRRRRPKYSAAAVASKKYPFYEELDGSGMDG
jgi:hypothetical protein